MIIDLLTIVVQKPFKCNNLSCSHSVVYHEFVGQMGDSLIFLVSLIFACFSCTTVHLSLASITDNFGVTHLFSIIRGTTRPQALQLARLTLLSRDERRNSYRIS